MVCSLWSAVCAGNTSVYLTYVLARLRVSHPRVFPAEEVRRALAARLSRDGLVVEIDARPADVMAIELAAAEFEPAP